MSAETSPLLPQSQGQAKPKSNDHHIFLRVCHTAWSFISTETLLASRATIMTYMMVVWGFALQQEIAGENDARLFPFYIGNISYTLQTGYFMLATFWSLQHYSSPRNRPQRERSGGVVGQVLSLHERAFSMISIPRTTEFTAAKRFMFSVWYSAAQTYPFVVTFLHYCVLGDRDGSFVTGDSKRDWISFSIFAANSGTVLLETFMLSSVRSLTPFIEHCAALSTATGLYFAWAKAGHGLTGTWTYTYVDPEAQDEMGMFVNVVTSMALTMGMFLVVMGIHAVRDSAAQITGLGKAH